jgi:FKBP-type peptidyl-prolyl cis-trans isomerase
MSLRRALVLTTSCLALLAVSGCGDDEEETTASGTATTVPTPAPTPTKPKVDFEKAKTPPKDVVKEDLKPGTGDTIAKGDAVSVHYVGVLYDDKKQFDASYDSGQQFNLTVGAGDVIKCWDEGLVGVKVGGRRQLTCPPDKAYGKQGSPPTIGKNATLVFVIDVIEKL